MKNTIKQTAVLGLLAFNTQACAPAATSAPAKTPAAATPDAKAEAQQDAQLAPAFAISAEAETPKAPAFTPAPVACPPAPSNLAFTQFTLNEIPAFAQKQDDLAVNGLGYTGVTDPAYTDVYGAGKKKGDVSAGKLEITPKEVDGTGVGKIAYTLVAKFSNPEIYKNESDGLNYYDIKVVKAEGECGPSKDADACGGWKCADTSVKSFDSRSQGLSDRSVTNRDKKVKYPVQGVK